MIRLLVGIVFVLSLCQSANADFALHSVNAIRSYTGLYPFRYDHRLQMEAQAQANKLARAGRVFHPGGRRYSRMEGTGMKSGYDPRGRRFFSCLMNTRKARYAGAATAYANGRTYYALVLR